MSVTTMQVAPPGTVNRVAGLCAGDDESIGYRPLADPDWIRRTGALLIARMRERDALYRELADAQAAFAGLDQLDREYMTKRMSLLSRIKHVRARMEGFGTLAADIEFWRRCRRPPESVMA